MHGRESRVLGLTGTVESAKLDELPRERPWRAGLGVRPILENSTACQIIVDAKLTPPSAAAVPSEPIAVMGFLW